MFGTCENNFGKRAVIVAEDFDLRILFGLKYARTILEEIIVFGTFANDDDEQNVRLSWSKLRVDIPLVLRCSPDGGITQAGRTSAYHCGSCTGSTARRR